MDIKKDELTNVILDKTTYMSGYFSGVSSVLRSSGNVDPLALSADFASLQKDMKLLQDSILKLIDLIDGDEEITNEEIPEEDLGDFPDFDSDEL